MERKEILNITGMTVDAFKNLFNKKRSRKRLFSKQISNALDTSIHQGEVSDYPFTIEFINMLRTRRIYIEALHNINKEIKNYKEIKHGK